MRINARFALPAVGVVAGAALIAAMPAEAQPQSQTNNEASVVTPAAKQAAIASAEKQEASSALRHQEAVKAAADKAAADKAAAEKAAADAAAQAEAQAQAQSEADAQAAASAAVAAAQPEAQPAEAQPVADTAYVAPQSDVTYSAPQGDASGYSAPPADSGNTAPVDAGYTGTSGGGLPSGASSGSYSSAVAAALAQVGSAYVAGGQGPGGFDCSGLVKWAYEQAGVSLPGGSYNQINYGTSVDAGSLQPGDLVFYGPGGSQHVAMYVGDGQVVQAGNYDTGVTVNPVDWAGTPSGYQRL